MLPHTFTFEDKWVNKHFIKSERQTVYDGILDTYVPSILSDLWIRIPKNKILESKRTGIWRNIGLYIRILILQRVLFTGS